MGRARHEENRENTNWPDSVSWSCPQGPFWGAPGRRAAEVSSLSHRDQLHQLMPRWSRKSSQTLDSSRNTPPLPSARLVPHSEMNTGRPLAIAPSMRWRSSAPCVPAYVSASDKM